MNNHNPYDFFVSHTGNPEETEIERLVREYYKERWILTFYYAVCFVLALAMFLILITLMSITTSIGALLLYITLIAWAAITQQRSAKIKEKKLQEKKGQIKHQISLSPIFSETQDDARDKLVKSLKFILPEFKERIN